MSLRYLISRIVVQLHQAQGSMRAVQGAGIFKDSATKSIKDTANSKRVRRFSTALESNSKGAAVTGGEDKGKRAEESLRMVMYLSCWGPN